MAINTQMGFGVIGCGDIAVTQHLPALAANPEARVLAVCDSQTEQAARAAATFGVPCHGDDYHELLQNAEVDAVVVATPPWVTPEITMDALRAGKDVLCEKPMALTVAEAEQVAEVERRTGQLVQVGFTYRHGPLMDALRGWIASGRLGSPLVMRLGMFDETWAPEANPEHYQRIISTLGHGPPCIHDGAHSADQLNFLTNSHAVRVTAHGLRTRPEFPADNYNAATIEFANGDLAKLEIGWFFPHLPAGEFEIIGPLGHATFDSKKMESILRTSQGVERVHLDEDWMKAGFRFQLDKFVDCLQQRRTPVPGTREGLASLRLTKAMEQSMLQQIRVSFDAERTSTPKVLRQ